LVFYHAHDTPIQRPKPIDSADGRSGCGCGRCRVSSIDGDGGRDFDGLFAPLQLSLEKFPELPVKITLNSTLEIHTSPNIEKDTILSKLSAGQTATVIEYYPSGSNVWGRLKSGGWITLLWYPAMNELQYPTSWTMETLPPPPPSQ
jgi:hypothetical protein